MRKILTIPAFLALSMMLVNAQDAKKITVQSQLASPFTIYTHDIQNTAQGGNSAKTIGYSFRTNTGNKVISLLSILGNGSMLFSKNFVSNINPSLVFEIVKIDPAKASYFYVLAAIQTAASKFMPVLLKVDALTGTILSQQYFNLTIPEPVFAPADIFFDGMNKIELLCFAGNPQGTVKGVIYKIDFDIAAGTYDLIRITNPANPSGYMEFPYLNFIRGYHSGTVMYGELSFYGLENNSYSNNINRGIVYNRDLASTVTCKSYILGGLSTKAIQVNNTYQPVQVVSLQNTGQVILLEASGLGPYNILWDKKYSRSFTNPFNLHGLSHGSKGWSDMPDFFSAIYEQTGLPRSGYAYFTYNMNDGSLRQVYSYDLNVDYFSIATANPEFTRHITDGIDDANAKNYLVTNSFPLTSQTFQYFYFIENYLTADPVNCVNTHLFRESDAVLTKTDVTLVFTTITTDVPVSQFSSSELNIADPIIEPLCQDNGSRSTNSPEKTASQVSSSMSSIISDVMSLKVNKQIPETSHSQIVVKQQNNQLAITTHTKSIIQYTLYNESGQLLRQHKVNPNEQLFINLNDLVIKNSAILILKAIFNDGTSESKKIVVNL